MALQARGHAENWILLKSIFFVKRDHETYAPYPGYDYDDINIANIRDFDYITLCKKCPEGMKQAENDWDGNLGRSSNKAISQGNDALADLLLRGVYEDARGWEREIFKKTRNGQRKQYEDNEPLIEALDRYIGTSLKCHFMCTTCSEQEGIPDKTQTGCQKCLEIGDIEILSYRYQLHERKSIAMPRQFVQNRNIDVVLPKDCAYCEPGMQLKDDENECAHVSGDPEHNCCVQCAMNKYKEHENGLCVESQASQVTNLPQGATEALECKNGEKMVYCRLTPLNDGQCFETKPLYGLIWKQCIPCNNLEIAAGPASCTSCKKTNEGEIVEAGKCVQCDSCKYLDVSTEETSTEWYQYSYPKGECKPLARRRLNQHNNKLEIIGTDEYGKASPSDTHAMTVPAELPDHHAVILNPATEICSYVHCDQVCKAEYMFSDGCGPTNQNRAYVYIPDMGSASTSGLGHESVLLHKVNDALEGTGAFALDAWQLQSEGVCQDCEECIDGEFNEACNDYSVASTENIYGKGRCQACLQNCDTHPFGSMYSYMYHPDAVKGCHPESNSSKRSIYDPAKVRVTSDYECKQCASSVLVQDTNLYVVAGCGFNTKYYYHDANNGIKQSSSQEHNSDLLEDMQANKQYYREHGRLPYCPLGFYYDASQDDCALDAYEESAHITSEKEELIDPRKGITQSTYRVHCCKRCTECGNFNFDRKDTRHYRECDGSSLQDTQDHCVEKCPFGSYVNETGKTCVPCTSCQCGESTRSFVDDTCGEIVTAI